MCNVLTKYRLFLNFKDAPVTNFNITEILRIYFQSFVYVGRDDRPENQILKILDTGKPFMSLNATQKTEIIAYLCNELLCNQSIVKQVDDNIETVGNLRRDKWIYDCDLRKYKSIKLKREKRTEDEKAEKEGIENKEKEEKAEKEGLENGTDDEQGEKKEKPKEVDAGEAGLDDDSGDSGAENDENNATNYAEDEEPGMTNEELDKKIDKISRQCTMATNKLNKAVHGLRVSSLGQDRFRRRYWVLPAAGGVFVEGIESTDPDELKTNEWSDETILVGSQDTEENSSQTEKAEDNENEEKAKVDDDEDEKEENMDLDAGEKKLENGTVNDGDMEVERDEKLKKHVLKNDVKDETEVDEKHENGDALDDEKPEEVESDETKVNGKEISTEDAKENIKAKNEKTAESSDQSQWLSPIVASVLAGSMMFGQNTSTNGFPFPFPFPGLDANGANNKNSTSAVQKPWFSILPRMPCCETVTLAAAKASATSAEVDEKASKEKIHSDRKNDETAVSVASALPSDFSMQAFLYPQILNSLFGQQGHNGNGLGSPETLDGQADPSSIDGKHILTSTPSRAAFIDKETAETPLASQIVVAPFGLEGISATLEELADICPALQKKLAQQNEEQHDSPQKIAAEYQRGWWRITDPSQIKNLNENLHERGTRERQLQKHLLKYFNYITTKCKSNAAELEISELDRKICEEWLGAPQCDNPEDYNEDVACRFDVAVLEQVEALEEKIANSSMQIRGWRPAAKISSDSSVNFKHTLCEPLSESRVSRTSSVSEESHINSVEGPAESQSSEDDDNKNPVSAGRERLLQTEAGIERRYLKPPLGYKSSMVFLPTGGDEYADNAADENAPSGLVRWRDAVRECRTGSELALLLHFLESCIAWDKSIMRAVSFAALNK